MEEFEQAFTQSERCSYHPVSRAHSLKRNHLLPEMEPALNSRYAGNVDGGDASSVSCVELCKSWAKKSPQLGRTYNWLTQEVVLPQPLVEGPVQIVQNANVLA